MKSKKILVIVLFLITVLVGVAAVYVGLQLQEQPDVTPDDTSAFGSGTIINICGTNPPSGNWAQHDANPLCQGCSNGSCTAPAGGNVRVFRCNPGEEGSENGGVTCTRNEQVLSGTVSFSQAFNNDCQIIQMDVFGDSTYNQLRDFVVWRGNRFGNCGTQVTNTPTPTPTSRLAICGESCNTNADCAPSTGGARVICQNNRCVNENCPNNTTPGTICSCGNTASCGEPCGKNTLPLCGDGISECGFIGSGGITQCRESQRNPWNQYCLPTNPANGYTRQRCTTIAAWHLFAPNGQAVTTQAQVREACVPYTPTPTPSTTVSPTVSPTVTVSPTPSPTTTPTFTGQQCGDTCTPSNGASACPQDHTCVDPNNDNVGTCVLNLCVQNSNLCYSDGCTPVPDCGEVCDPSQSNACSVDHSCLPSGTSNVCVLNQCNDNPALCEADRCTPIDAITVTKAAVSSCSSTGDQLTATYTIRVTNPNPSSRTVTVTDNISLHAPGSQVQTSSISNGGSLSGTIITWSNLSLPASSSVDLTYQVVYNRSSFNSASRNIVVVTEGGIERGRTEYTLVPFCLAGTALISDEADRIIIAALLITLGFAAYRFKAHQAFGEIVWNGALVKIIGKNNPLSRKILEDQAQTFESGAIRKIKSDE
ncbi:MAG: hypothetical protein QY330_04615 [Candidatus Dojkabacteria bacterium]|nr:MAG: hypothetical protein QY330_04615 [Candidatus Dojkabacteria bacterium]